MISLISHFPYFNALGTNFETTFIKFKQNIVLKWLQRRQLASFWLFWGRSGVPFWLLWGVLGPLGLHFIMPWRISAQFFRDLGLPRLSKHPSSPIPDALQFSNPPSFQMGEAECAERLNPPHPAGVLDGSITLHNSCKIPALIQSCCRVRTEPCKTRRVLTLLTSR